MKLKLEPKVKTVVNMLVSRWFCRLFEVKRGTLYLLVDHHKYSNVRNAKKVKVGKAIGDGLYYITENIK